MSVCNNLIQSIVIYTELMKTWTIPNPMNGGQRKKKSAYIEFSD